MMAKRKRARRRGKSEDADTGEPEQTGPEFPKRMVRLLPGPGNSVITDVVVADSSDAEGQLSEQGYKPLEFAEEPRPEYPSWRYAADGSCRLVNTEEEDNQLEGEYYDTPEGIEATTPIETDISRATVTLGSSVAAKLDLFLDRALGLPRAAKKADGNFDPSTVPIVEGQSTEETDQRVQASRATAEARRGTR